MEDVPKLSESEMITQGAKAGIAVLREREEGRLFLEFANNSEAGAKYGSFPLSRDVTDAIYRRIGEPSKEIFGKIITEIALWAEDNGWKRKDSEVGATGVIELRK